MSWSSDSNKLATSTLGHLKLTGETYVTRVDARSQLSENQEIFSTNGLGSQSMSNCWHTDGTLFISGAEGIEVRPLPEFELRRTLEGYARAVVGIALAPTEPLLASITLEGIDLWRIDSFSRIASFELKLQHVRPGATAIAFHPSQPLLAALANGTIYLFRLDYDRLLAASTPPPTHYTNAKVVLIGNSGSGKSCIAHSLLGEPFVPQESTHGMHVWTLHGETIEQGEHRIERETLLWDLAGQTDYQLVHQLFLDETALALVLFDPGDTHHLFAGVGHWEKALRRIAGEEVPRLLVAGRVDRGYPAATERDIEEFRRRHGFLEYLPTSAKTGAGIDELRRAIERHIPWERLPVTTSPLAWRQFREYLLERSNGEELLASEEELLADFRLRHPDSPFSAAELATVVRHAQAQGLVWRLSFGNLVLLRPEMLNGYAAAVVQVARSHPQGLGCVRERDVLDGLFDFADLARIPADEERRLLYAVVELFLARELAVREGKQLVFPSKFNREHPEYPRLPRREVSYRFQGAVEEVQAILMVRLFYSGAFILREIYRNAAELADRAGGPCGLVVEAQEGEGRVHVFFGEATELESRVLFLRFVHEHLHRRAVRGSVVRERVYRCPSCGEEVHDREVVERRLADGRTALPCQYCDAPIPLVDLLEERFADPALLARVRALDEVIESAKGVQVGLTTTRAKEEFGEFDVFLAHSSADKPAVEHLAQRLRERGLNPWLDVEQIPPGRWFQEVIQEAIPRVRSAAVVIGAAGLGRWQALELKGFVSRCVEEGLPVIPVLLPGVGELPAALPFLRELQAVRFRQTVDEAGALDRLQWGITGERPLLVLGAEGGAAPRAIVVGGPPGPAPISLAEAKAWEEPAAPDPQRVAAMEQEARLQKAKLKVWREISDRSAHKIGNQLFAAQGELRLLERRGDEAVKESVARLRTILGRINAIVAEYRRYNREERLSIVTTDLGALVREVADAFRAAAAGVALDVEVAPGLPAILVDGPRVRDALSELVQNALHHTPTGGRIGLAVEAVRTRAGPRLRVTVSDTGPGVAPGDKQRIFDPFVGQRPGGTGLGLAIVKSIVENHGGTVAETGEPGQGARFEVLLPVNGPIREGE